MRSITFGHALAALALLLGWEFAGAAGPCQGASGAANKARNETVVSQFLAALSTSQPADLPGLFTETVHWETMDSATVLKTLQSLPGAFRELRVTPKQNGFITQGDRVAVAAVSNGIRTSGQPYHNAYEFLFILKDGKIDEIHTFAVGPER